MGSSWAHYDALSEAKLIQYWDLPARIPDEEWIAMLTKVTAFEEQRLLEYHLTGCMDCYDDPKSGIDREHPHRESYEAMMRERVRAQAKSEAEAERDRLLRVDVAPIDPNNYRVIDGMDAAQAIFKYVAAECDARHIHTFDVIEDASNESKMGHHLSGDEKKQLRDVWSRFLSMLGYPETTEALPWWVAAAYPDSQHYIGAITAERARAFSREVRALDLKSLAAETLGAHVVKVFDLLEAAGEENRTVIAIESVAT